MIPVQHQTTFFVPETPSLHGTHHSSGERVKLGAEPLELEEPRHLALMKWTYGRFPQLGVRLSSA
jgi:hypothetical protein